ncbi:MAG: GNAT family N-acetyltransferase [Rhizobiales bacterium]|nr:GNAT family N-acetyltransferase [Hyphomicrobiales bacterium]
MVEIKLVRTHHDAAVVSELAYEFIGWLRVRYPDRENEIDQYLKDQRFEEQIKDVLIHYTPPKGECLLALHDDAPVGLLMLKRLDAGTCEMNRMFVREAARGLGVGRSLVAGLKNRARDMGFASMVLSVLPRHYEALALYETEGFRPDNWVGEVSDHDNAIHMRVDL